MTTPALTPVHDRLAALSGRWRGTETLEPSPWSPGGEAEAEMTFAATAGGFAVVQDYRSERDGETLMSGHGVLSVLPSSECVLWHWFDSVGHPPIEPATGGWDGDALVLERSSERGTNRTTLTLTGDVLEQEITFRPASDGAASGTLVRARYLRVS